jgi:hypothetical protein
MSTLQLSCWCGAVARRPRAAARERLDEQQAELDHVLPRAGITVVVERGRARSRRLSPALHTSFPPVAVA